MARGNLWDRPWPFLDNQVHEKNMSVIITELLISIITTTLFFIIRANENQTLAFNRFGYCLLEPQCLIFGKLKQQVKRKRNVE